MPHEPLLSTVIGSYPLPGWLELASEQLDRFGPEDVEELRRDATTVAIADQVGAGIELITDGEQGRFDFNLSFYGWLDGLEYEPLPARRLGPPLHDQRGRHRIVGELAAPDGLGTLIEWRRLAELAPPEVALKVSVPGPYTLAGRLEPGGGLADRWEVSEALRPIVTAELETLVDDGCEAITLDEPSMSCYAHREDTARLVDLFNRTVEPVVGRCYLGAHLCFGNFKGRAAAPRRYAPMFPDFLGLDADELHLEMASREASELELIATVAEDHDVGVGIVDVKSGYVESVELLSERIRACLEHVPAERLSLSPDCGLSQTARWAARAKLENLSEATRTVREEL